MQHCLLELAGSEKTQSVHLTEALHAEQPPEADAKLAIDHGVGFSLSGDRSSTCHSVIYDVS